MNATSHAQPTAVPATCSADLFGDLVDPFRRELTVHCYRMLGSIDDAEDAVQDALVNAWRGRGTYREDISLRAWLYRIATNACLDAIQRRKRGRGREESLGVGPYPDQLLGNSAAGPDARYDARESISLAFLTALQVLPPRQRALLILRDVLSWRATEVALLLDLSVPAVNSALQRARATVARQCPGPAPGARRASSEPGHLRSLLERYVRVWEAADIPGLVALLREDAVLSMPPQPTVLGADAIGAFLEGSILSAGRSMTLVATEANGRPAFGAYVPSGHGARRHAFAILVLEVDEPTIARIDAFAQPQLFARFDLPLDLAG